ncbi:MAG: sigma 54-interacting transcriptional regulator [Bacteroidia bacterium]|nr:sigma 54-interacting transcriptional regulator [Bacteroidia bacterium]
MESNVSQDLFKKIVHPEDLKYLMDQHEKLELKESLSGLNFRIIRPNKEVRHIVGSATPIFDENGSLIKITGINIDVTEDRLAEEKLAKTNAELIDAVSSLNKLKKQLEDQNIYLKKELDLVFNFEEMVYGSAVFSEVLTDLERVAPTDATVLILGESGTGKELIARALHNLSLRKNKPLIKVNCSAIPSELIESELFGHKKGSFTGAVSDKVGKFELADGGTLFLDEIGDLPLAMQPKLLRFLQEGEMEVVGGTTTKSLDVRIIAATNKDLEKEVNKEQFREDLYFRLNVFPIEIPPLRERKEDIPLLVEHFCDKYGKKYRKNVKYISDSAMQSLRNHNWPGNIRELENLIERSVILSDTETLNLQGFGANNNKKNRSISNAKLTLNEVQRNHIIAVLEKTNWKIGGPDGAANILDIKPSTFRDKMKKLGIKRPN